MITLKDREKIAKWILTTEDDFTIEKVKTLMFDTRTVNEDYKDLYNKEIDEAVSEIESGKFFTQEEADKLLSEWEEQ